MDGEVYHSWSSCVKATRELLGLTQAQAAQRSSMALNLWARMEHVYTLPLPGESAPQPHFDTVRKVGRALCVDIRIDFPYVPAEPIRYTVVYRPEALVARGD